MIRLQMLFAWFFAFIIGFFAIIAISTVELFLTLFDLPSETWEVVKEKYQESE